MAFKRSDRDVYYTELRVGDITLPRLSTGLTSKESAEQLENAIRQAYTWGFTTLVEQVALRNIGLDEVWKAWNADDPRAALRKLQEEDPPLADEVQRMLSDVTDDERVRVGLERIREFAPDEAPLSWLTDHANINKLYRDVGKGRTQGTVYRTVHRAVCDLLSDTVGKGEMQRIIAEVKKPKPAGTRVQILSAKQIQGLVYNAPDELRPSLAVAVLTGIDRGPLVNLRVKDYDADRQILWVRDTKADARPRSLPLEDGMAAWVEHMAAGKKPTDSLTGLDAEFIRDRWEKLREDRGLADLTWKDLRGVFATWAHQCAWDALRIQMWIGHSNPVMTQRYIKHVQLITPEPRPIAEAMGIAEVR